MNVLNGFTKFSLGAMAISFIAIIIILISDTVGINPEPTTTTRALLILIAYVISYLVLSKLKVLKKISEYVNSKP